MQESLGKKYVSLDEMMVEVVVMRGRCAQRACEDHGDGDVEPGAPAEETLRGRRAHARRPCKDRGCGWVTPGAPVPLAVPGEFTIKLGMGWGESLEDLVEEMESYEFGAGAAAAMLLSWLEFVRIEGVEECRDLVEGLRRLRGAIMVARAAGCRQGTGGG
jgi:hypothetical protein